VRTLTYDMIRDSKKSQLTAIAVFLVDVDAELKQPNLPLDPNPQSIKAYVSLISSDLSSPKVFSNEGSKVTLVTN
jgi:hypothetical protein